MATELVCKQCLLSIDKKKYSRYCATLPNPYTEEYKTTMEIFFDIHNGHFVFSRKKTLENSQGDIKDREQIIDKKVKKSLQK